MNNMTAIIPVAAAAYVATNLDNFFLLVALLARYRKRGGQVIAGFFVCALIFAVVGILIGKSSSVIPVEYLGLLGFIPISMGVYELLQLWRNRKAGNTSAGESDAVDIDNPKKVFVSTLGSQLGNGTDTILVFGVLFIDSAPSADFLAILTFGAMAFVFVLAAIYAVRLPALADWIYRYANYVVPFILIFVGVYILTNTATDIVAG